MSITDNSVSNPVRATAFKNKLSKEVTDLIDFSEELNILEVGCGSGWLCLQIGNMLHNSSKIIGIDVNEKAINQATSTLKPDNIQFLVKDINNIDYKNQFDYIISVNSYHHFIDHEKALGKIKEALKPDGKFLVVDFNGDSGFMRILDKFSIDHKGPIRFQKSRELENALTLAGLQKISITKKRIYGVFSIMVVISQKKLV